MTTTTHVRRCVGMLASAGAATALTLYPSGGAHAAVNGDYAAFGESFVNYTGNTPSGECDVVSGEQDTQSSDAHFSHGTKHRSVGLDVTFASPDNPADTVRVKGHVDSSMTLKKKGRDLSSFVLAAGGRISVSHSMSHSHCSADGEVVGGTELRFSEHRKGWFTLTHDAHKPNADVEAILIDLTTGKEILLDEFSGPSSQATSKALLKPGTYTFFQTAVGVATSDDVILEKRPSRVTKASLTTSLTGVFKPLKK